MDHKKPDEMKQKRPTENRDKQIEKLFFQFTNFIFQIQKYKKKHSRITRYALSGRRIWNAFSEGNGVIIY